MRLRLIFNLKNRGAILPFHHQQMLVNFISSVLETNNGKFIDYSYFNFSGLKGQTQVTPLGLSYTSNRVTLVVSSQNKTFLDWLAQSIAGKTEVNIGQMVLEPVQILAEEIPIFGEMHKYVSISPLVLKGGRIGNIESKVFVDPFSDAFSDILYHSTLKRMELSGQYTADQIASYTRFQILPDKAYLAKIKGMEKKFARIYTLYEEGEKIEVRGYTFPFTLLAHPEVHKFVFMSGVGEYCNRGYGMIDNPEFQFLNRVKPYILPTTTVNFVDETGSSAAREMVA